MLGVSDTAQRVVGTAYICPYVLVSSYILVCYVAHDPVLSSYAYCITAKADMQ